MRWALAWLLLTSVLTAYATTAECQDTCIARLREAIIYLEADLNQCQHRLSQLEK